MASRATQKLEQVFVAKSNRPLGTIAKPEQRADNRHIDSDQFPVNMVGADRFTNWEGQSEEDYRANKGAWLDCVIERLDEEWSGFAEAVVQKDMVMARTMHDRLKTPGGALYGFAPNVPDRQQSGGPPNMPRTSITGLFLASTYVGLGGGFTGAMGAGGLAAKAALREFM